MKVVYLANNRVGLAVLERLMAHRDQVVGLVVHPDGRGTCVHEMVALTGLPEERVFSGVELRRRETRAAIEALGADCAVSVFFGYILSPKFLRIFPRGCINLHPALLPYNRGAFPNVWSIINMTPAGATLHLMDAGVDTGGILAQRAEPVYPWDTGASLYRRLETCCITLFEDAWPRFCAGELRPVAQELAGTQHRVSDVDRIDAIDLNAQVRAGDLIDILRARTFPPHPGAYFEVDGRRIQLRLELIPEPHKDDVQ